ncbi:MAG: hypothetical protein K0R05_3266 [Anaerocolumna sp.]|nr:hypothetical protein [Anaerocolumna sp.]
MFHVKHKILSRFITRENITKNEDRIMSRESKSIIMLWIK